MPSSDAVLTLTQALQLVGLVPCLFVIAFLLLRQSKQTLIPAAYFFSLACAFALPLLDIFFPDIPSALPKALLLAGESLLVAFGFLMILQFITGHIPTMRCWLVLAIPLAGTAAAMATGAMQGECISGRICDDIESIRALYNVFGSLLVFLLLVYYLAKFSGFNHDDTARRHKYALIVSLISVHLMVLAVELAQLAGRLTPTQSLSLETVFRLTFIYLAITSLFRVFYPSRIMQVEVPASEPAYDPTPDLPHVKTLEALLMGGVHREMRLNRAALAKKVGIGEHHLSRIINHHFGKSFNELINGYRIDEAKARLKSETTAITAIAFEVGFNSIASFNRVFKEKVGVSPTEYRQGLGIGH